MREHVPVRRLDSVSQNTQDIMIGVQATLDKLPTPAAVAVPNGPIAGNFVKLAVALESKRFTYAGKGLYKEADTENDFGRIWVVKEFDNPATGTKEKWLVAYTTDEDEIIRQLATEKKQALATAAAQPVPKAKDIPIAPGLKSKNLTLDETGGGGTAKVTLEFTDVDQGLKFYQEQQGAAPEKKEEPKEGEGEPAGEEAAGGSEGQGPAPAAPGAPGAPVPPVPPAGGMAAPAQAGLKSTVVPITRFGHTAVAVRREKKEGKTTLAYVNEKGEKWVLAETFDAIPGRIFTRPDTGETARFAGYIDVNYESVDSLIEVLAGIEKEGKNFYCNTCSAKFSDKQKQFHSGHNTREYGDETDKTEKTAADVSDNVPPMSFKTQEGQGNPPEGAGPALPPNPSLQDNQPQGNVLYDSSQDSGPQFQTTIDPKSKSVTVKFVDSQAEQALQDALGQPKPPAAPAPGAPAPGAPAPGAQLPGPGAQPAQFDQQKIPTEF